MQYYWNLCVFVGIMCGMEGEMCNTIGISVCLLEECVEWKVRCAILWNLSACD